MHTVSKHALLRDGERYKTEYNQILRKQSFNEHPFRFLVENSMREWVRILRFDFNKRFLPFFKRSNIAIEEPEKLKRFEASLHKDEHVSLNHPAFRIKKGHLKDKLYNVVVIVLETFEESTSDSFKDVEQTSLTFLEK